MGKETRFGAEQDTDIRVRITDTTGNPYCFQVSFGERTVINLHARSLLDLIRKSQIALLDWIAAQAGLIARNLEKLSRTKP